MDIADQLIQNFARIARSSGGGIRLVSATESRIVIGYDAGDQAPCEAGACTLPHLELQQMMAEWLSRRLPGCTIVVTPTATN